MRLFRWLGALLLLLAAEPAQAAFQFQDLVCQTTTTTGTGTLTLSGTSGFYLPFSSTITSGSTVPYGITTSANKFETGQGVFTSPSTLTRTAEVSSDGLGDVNKLNLPAGTHTVCVNFTSSTFGDNDKGDVIVSGGFQSWDLDELAVETELEAVLDLDQMQGNIGVSHLNSGTGASSSTFWRGDATWAVPAGGVSATGTPVDNQIAVWTSASVLEGDTAFTFNTTNDALFVQGQIELSNATANTLTAAAGVLSIEGVALLTAASGDALFLTPAEGNAAYQPLDADLTSWALITRAAGYDTFATTPSSANLDTLVIDDTGSGALVFGTSPVLATPTIDSIEFAAGTANTFTCTGGNCTIEGNGIYRVGGTDVAVADGGTGASSLTDLIALTTMTTGVYVAQVADGTGIDGTANAEGATYTPTLDLTEQNSQVFGSGTFTTMVFDAGVTDPTFTFASNSIAITNAGTFTVNGVSFQPIDSDLTSWALITRASGFDTWVASPTVGNLATLLTDEAAGFANWITTPTSANLQAFMTNEVGTGVLVFLGTPADDQVPVGDSASATTWRTLPDSDLATQKLQYDQTTNTFSAGTDDDVPEVGDFGALVGGTGITNSAGTLSVDGTELGTVTWGAAATVTWTFDVGATDLVQTYTNPGTLTFSAGGTSPIVQIDDQGELRWFEEDAGGANYVTFSAPATLAANRTCVFQDSGPPIPDSCVGDGTDNTGAGGTVSAVGTPVDNQVAVWTGAASIEGDTAFTFDTTTDLLTTGSLTTVDDVSIGDDLSLTSTGALINIGPAADCIITHSSNTLTLTGCTAVGFGASIADADYGDITVSGGGTVWTVDPDSVALTTDTTGVYVAQVADGTGIDGTANAEGATYTPVLDLTEQNSQVFGSGTFTTAVFDAGATDPTFTFASNSIAISNAATFTVNGLTPVYTTRTLTGGVGIAAVGDLSADRTITLDTTEVNSNTWGNGTFTTMTFDAGAVDPVWTYASNSVTLGSAATVSFGTTAAFTTGTIELGAASDTTIARSGAGAITVEGSAVQLASTVDVVQVADGTGIDGTCSTAACTYTPTLDLTEQNSQIFGSGAFTTMVFDAGATDPTFTFASNSIVITNAATFTVNGVAFQPVDADLTSWAAITRAAGFDTFATTPSMANLGSLLTDDAAGWTTFGTTPTSANLRTLMTDELGTGVLVFLGAPADDQVPVGDSATATTWRTLPDSDLATQKLQYDQATNTFSAGTDDDVPEVGDFGALVGGTGITVSAGTISVDATELSTVTWGSGGTITSTFDVGATDFVATYTNPGTVTYSAGGTSPIINIDDQGELRWLEEDAGGANYVTFSAPATLAANRTCVFQDSGPPIPDSCVGDGADSGGSITDADYGDITVTSSGTVWTIDPDSVALTTDTTGNYVGSVADGTGIDGTASGEGATYTPTLDFAEISPSVTWGAGSFTTMIWDAGATDPTATFASNSVTWSNAATFSLGTAAAFTTGTIELGAATDTTIARSGAAEATLEGDAIKHAGIQTLWIPASAMTIGTSGSPSTATIEISASANYISVLDFDGTALERAYFNVSFPKSWNEGTITYRVYWTVNASVTTVVSWNLAGVYIPDNTTLNGTFGTLIEVTGTASSAAHEQYISPSATTASSAVTIGGTPAEGGTVLFRIFRDPVDASDTMTQDARLIGVKIFYTDNAGSDD